MLLPFKNPTQAVRPLKLRRPHARRRKGFTLIEILIGAVVTLVLLGVLVRAFVVAGGEINNGQAAIELTEELRSVSEVLRNDLRSATSRTVRWSSVGASEGYLEIFERGTPSPPQFIELDGDRDILMLTTKNLEELYRGLYDGDVIESKVAEIAWWTEGSRLYRRVLLVAPYLNSPDGFIFSPGGADAAARAIEIANFKNNNDISVRLEDINNDGIDDLVANTLADLSRRENRFAHNSAFPGVPELGTLAYALTEPRIGEDVILSQVHAFDVQVFDPTAQVRGATLPDGSTIALSPSDPGWSASAGTDIKQGTYVDLGYAPAAGSQFSGPVHPKSSLGPFAIYDTWSASYEHDGINQDVVDDGLTPPDELIDEGTDGIDNDSAFGIDDEAERETSPPYLAPLRALKVTLRIRNVPSQQVRQTSVESSFIPE